uniref:Uncharacterized protein n=1 Tax=Rousettus aegyptiacus TaxID=9407 RepID=A0A7J8FJ08_ROUAE|nr:hypothetical protein HJG63_012077 [Rousettus aegyptiacus]
MAEPSSPSSSSPFYTVPEGHFQNENLIVVLACSVLFYSCLLPRLSLVGKESPYALHSSGSISSHLISPQTPHTKLLQAFSAFLPSLSSLFHLENYSVLRISSKVTNAAFRIFFYERPLPCVHFVLVYHNIF